jgi:hypothetical protein
MAVKSVPHGPEGTVERFGRVTGSLRPGLGFIVPFIDRIGAKINMMEQVLDVPRQEVITKDNAMVSVDGVVFYQVLDSVTLVLKEFDKTLIDVEGHTDSDGSDAYNLQLSQQRAGSVGSYLQSHGVNSQRIVTAGVGEARPIASNATADGKQQNRRVELKLQPITEG